MQLRKLCAVLISLLILVPPVAAQTATDIRLSTGSKYVSVAGIIWGTQFNQTYVMVPIRPEIGVCVFVVNNNPTSAHSFTLNVFQTADPAVTDYNDFKGRYQTANLQGMPATVGAGATVSGWVATQSAAQIAFKFAGGTTQAGSPDTADIFFVQVENSSCGVVPSGQFVQGPIGIGVTGTSANPVLVGGIDNTGAARLYKACQDASGVNCAGSTGYMMPIGAGGNTIGSMFNSGSNPVTSPNAAAGPLAVVTGAAISSTGLTVLTATGGTASNFSNQSNPSAIFTTRSGFYRQRLGLTVTSTLDDAVNGTTIFVGNFVSCFVSVKPTLNSGTTPTLNVYFQAGGDAATYSDRISFAQFTTSGNQWGGINASVSGNPVAFQSGTLAAGTHVDGPIGPFLNMHFVAGGTTPNWTVSYAVACY